MALWKSRSEGLYLFCVSVLRFSFCPPSPQRRGDREAAEFSRDVTQLAGRKICLFRHARTPPWVVSTGGGNKSQISPPSLLGRSIGPESCPSRARTLG